MYAALTDVPSLELVSVPSLTYLKDQTLETYLIGQTLDLYGIHMSVRLNNFIRPPIPFVSMTQMAQQIQKDLYRAGSYTK